VKDRISRLEAEVARLGREHDEARQQQAATAEVLRIISNSPSNAQPVFQAIVDSAARLCAAAYCFVFRFDGELMHFVAHNGIAAEAVAAVNMQFPLPPGRTTGAGRAILSRQVAQVLDMRSDPDYEVSALTEVLQLRSVLAVPMLRDGVPIGVITVDRREAGRFPERQVELLRMFADQAVIAVENVRLFEEVTEALKQQTVTADTLKLISQSAFDLKSVLHALVEAAAHLCDADKVSITRERDGQFFRSETYGFSEEFLDYVRDLAVEPGRQTADCRALAERKVVHIPDVLADPEYTFLTAQKLGNFRTVLSVPMLRQGIPVGVMALTRTEVRSFTDKQISLVRTFADQAVIAIENVRLFSELDARNREISEALEQQTASADVLKVISRSVGETAQVFEAILESAARLCEASFANLALCAGDGLRHAASFGRTPEWDEYRLRHAALRPLPSSAIARALATGAPVHVHDGLNDQAYFERDPGRVGVVEILGARTILSVPLLKDGAVVGVITIHRREVRDFTEKQIALVANFASQAVIAIENARLLAELEARNREILSRYFSPNLAERLAAAGADEIEFSGQRREVAVLFSDIEGFTSLVETMEPGMLGELLNGYLAGMTSVVFSHEGTVAKIVGDALHVLFGAPGDQPDRAARAVACALDLDLFSQSFRKLWSEKGVALGPTRIGVNAGPAIVGNFGGGRFFDYTAYGDTINIAARLETANKQIGTRVCISESVVGQLPDFRVRPVGDLMLRGRTEPLRAYEPLRSDERDDASVEGYLKAFARLEASDPGAMGAFAAEVGRQPDDRLAGFHLKRLLNGATGTRIHLD
jgi:class 3 adenylate cyclase/putative methionine-R-sulfoxide reductase with GAF domain